MSNYTHRNKKNPDKIIIILVWAKSKVGKEALIGFREKHLICEQRGVAKFIPVVIAWSEYEPSIKRLFGDEEKSVKHYIKM